MSGSIGTTITSANAVYMLTVAGLFPSPVQLQGFATDSAIDTEAVEVAETRLGVDGFMSAGWIPRMTKQTIALQADSPSGFLFETWALTQDAQEEVFIANGVMIVPGIGRKYTLVRGVLTSFSVAPGLKKTSEVRNFVITWNEIQPGPV